MGQNCPVYSARHLWGNFCHLFNLQEDGNIYEKIYMGYKTSFQFFLMIFYDSVLVEQLIAIAVEGYE